MGVKFLYHPDTVLTAADLESLAVSLLTWLPLPGVEGEHLHTFDPEVIWRTVVRASVGQKSTKAVTDETLRTYSDDYTLAQLHTIPATILEEISLTRLPHFTVLRDWFETIPMARWRAFLG